MSCQVKETWGGMRMSASVSVCVFSTVCLLFVWWCCHRNDIAFDLSGYTFVLLNNISTTCNGE